MIINDYNSHEVFLAILKSINDAKEFINQATQIDVESFGDKVEVSNLIRIIDEALMQQSMYNSTIIKNKYGKYAMETRYFNIGEFGIMIEGNNPYAFFELLLNLILTHNKGCFNMNHRNYGINNLLLTIVNKILEDNFNIKDAYNIKRSENFFDEYNNFILIGNKTFLNSFNSYNNKKIIKYCYNNFNVFIDDINLISAIDKQANVYSNLDMDIQYNKVLDIDEAISMINKEKYNYTSTILSNNKENTLKFLTTVQSRYVFSNVLLSANNRVGINQSDLLVEKTIAYQENA